MRKPAAKWEITVSVLLAIMTSSGVSATAPSGVVGGQDLNGDAYAAFVSLPDGTITPILGLPTTATIFNTSINASGTALLGGQTNGSDCYATYVAPDGTLTPLTLAISGSIEATAINSSGLGLLGGNDSLSYAAFVTPDGMVTPITTAISEAASISGVALNDAGVGLVAGEGLDTSVYVAYVTNDGTVTGIPTGTAANFGGAVAINAAGNGIVGGSNYPNIYAALLFYNDGSPTLTAVSPLPGGFGEMFSVAINNSGAALIGGQDGDYANIYAAVVAPITGIATPLFPDPSDPGAINSVALNDAGTGLIGGVLNSNVYAAFVQPDATLVPLFTSPLPGYIMGVAINQAGVGLIGGQINSDSYAALVAPDGTLTPLDVSGSSGINATALNNLSAILDQTTPGSTGPYANSIYTQFAVVKTLETHFIEQNKLWNLGQSTVATAQNDFFDTEELTANSREGIFGRLKKSFSPKEETRQQNCPCIDSSYKNMIWLAPFGDYLHLSAEGTLPSVTNKIGGALVAYDRIGPNFLVGGTLGYAFNYVHYSNHLGHGKIQQELASVYGAYYTDHFWFDVAFWGGLYQFWNTRHTLSSITSKGQTHGWIFSPHLEMASPWAMDQKKRYFVEPFVTFDWTNNWLHPYTETGAAGFNLQVKGQYNSILQSEAGLRFYENFLYCWGSFYLEEKLSYINQTPFNFHNTTTSFVASASSFPIAVGSSKIQNLASLQLTGFVVPKNNSYPYTGFSLEATANRSYQSYFAQIFAGWAF